MYGEAQSGGKNLERKRASLQALKLQANRTPTPNQGFKLQAQAHKLQDP